MPYLAKNCALSPFIICLLTGLMLLPIWLCAQERRPELTGEIPFEEQRQTSAYAEIQDQTIAAFEQLASYLKSYVLSSPTSNSAPRLGSEELNFLTGVYLHCSVQRGTCPMLLESLLEFDLLQAVEAKDRNCPALKNFWRRWLENDMENRHRYLVRTGNMQASFEFNQLVRPRYIRCEKTIEEILPLTGGVAAGELLRQRYQHDPTLIRPIEASLVYLREIRASIPNIFVATGS